VELHGATSRRPAALDSRGLCSGCRPLIGYVWALAPCLPDPGSDHVTHACDLALAMVEGMPTLNAEPGTDVALRVGVNTGNAVAGAVSTSRSSYDVRGDTLNLTSRLESNGPSGVVAVSAGVALALDRHHRGETLGTKNLTGQGPTEIYQLVPQVREPA
jgi:adenylate cyclase